jgi:Mg-chelatase subunit ChlD
LLACRNIFVGNNFLRFVPQSYKATKQLLETLLIWMMNLYIQDVNEEKKIEEEELLHSSPARLLLETEHARLRRKQRDIDKKDLNAALQYGTRAPQYWGKARIHTPNVYRYTYNDIVYVVDEKEQKEVTCFAIPLTLEQVKLDTFALLNHSIASLKATVDRDSWTSNTVMVIDTSGSMRTSDVWGARSRLASVWTCVALDFLAQRLESGAARTTDVISIVAMGERPEVLFLEEPTSWTLYNKIVELYMSRQRQAVGHGYFRPSLSKAEELLTRNSNAACAAALLFLSDGLPSDKGRTCRKEIVEKVESLAKNFGRRLTFTTIGIGSNEEFEMLQKMVDAAKDYGVVAEFKLPSMTSSALGETFTSVATSLTTSQTEMTDLGTLKQRKVRDVTRESRSKASQVLTHVSAEDFYFYPLHRVTRKVYMEEIVNGKCRTSYMKESLNHPDACYVAFAKGAFGEGAERFAYRFFEVAADCKTILGPPLVAKENRMLLDEDRVADEEARQKYGKVFCKTQQLALRLAKKFNERLKSNARIHRNTPHVSFLDCSIYTLDDVNIGVCSVLVEKKLDHNKWYKWNSNNGMVNGVKMSSENIAKKSMQQMKVSGINKIASNLVSLDLGMIEEGSEEEEDEDSNEESVNNDVRSIVFTPSQVAQAFSHFSYHESGRKRLVCDLQGVFNDEKNLLQFSDPVIHYYNHEDEGRKNVHGRTDRGRKGIEDFFATHSCQEHCGGLCQLVIRGFRRAARRNQANPTRRPRQPMNGYPKTRRQHPAEPHPLSGCGNLFVHGK